MGKDMEDNDLWVVFKIKNCGYAVHSGCVVSIEVMPDIVTKYAGAEKYVKGIMPFRGDIIPLIEVRSLFEFKTLEQEYKEFQEMLDARKQDHIRWVETLDQCIRENKPFLLATDPHKCAFGKWYDNFSSESQSVNFHMKKIEEPHRKLHHTALEAESCKKECDKCKRSICLNDALKKAEEEYKPVILGLMDQAKEVFRHSYRDMVIVLQKDERKIGILVDDVMGVESLEVRYDTANVDYVHKSSKKYIQGIASIHDGEEKVLLILNHDAVLSLGQNLTADHGAPL